MAERALRGTRLGATSYENDRNTDLAPRQDVPFDCPNGHHFSVPFAAEAELPPMWECRVCGAMATASTGDSPSPKKVKPPRSHWDMLMERRTVEDLEAVLAERLEVVRERRALEARAIADVASRRSAIVGAPRVMQRLPLSMRLAADAAAEWPRRRAAMPHRATRVKASRITVFDIFDEPRSRSMNVIGTSVIVRPAWSTRRVMSIWKQ